jgi:ribosomal protein L21E
MSKKTRALGHAQRTLTPAQLTKKYAVGQDVVIRQHSRYEGMPHPRYRGRAGHITAVRGASYEVSIRDGNMKKMLIVPPVHLRPAKGE